MTLSALAPKKRKYVKYRAKGHNKAESARKAGYAESVALNATSRIETPDVKEVFRNLVARGAPPEKVAQRIAEGIDAEKTEFFVKDGVVTDQRNTIAWSERRAYVELAAEYAGYVSPEPTTSIALHMLTVMSEPTIEQAAVPTPSIDV